LFLNIWFIFEKNHTPFVMDFKAELQTANSKTTAKKIAAYIGNDPKRFKILMDLFFDKDMRISQRASWPVGFCGEAYPILIYPYLKQMINNLDNPVHNAVKRNTIRIMGDIELPEDLLGEAADICFRFLDDPKEAIATRVFSMTVCFNITKREPELANELKIIIEDHYPHGSAGFKSRANRILKELRKMID